MKISDISTASDLQAVINTDINNNNTSNAENRFDPSRVAVEVAPKTISNVRESRSTKNGKLRRF